MTRAQPGTLETWLLDTALPYWAAQGADTATGGFHERLDDARAPVTADGKRAMVQARQIYVFAQAALSAWLPEGVRLARAGRDFLFAHYQHPGGGWRFRVGRDGQPMDDTRDLYAHAFILFALAWLHRLDDGGEATKAAADTIAFLEGPMAHPAGGYCETLDANGQPVAGPRRQNPHMHLFEALLEWHAATDDDAWLARADSVAALLERRFCVDGTLREYFDDALAPLPGDPGRIVEPGHHYEWAWLLHRFQRQGGDARYGALAHALYVFAETHGVDGRTGGVFDALAPDGTPTQTGRRFWPQTEAIKGHAARYEATGDPAFARRMDRQAADFVRAHIDGVPSGGWREHLGPDGALLVPGLPASSLYHVTLAVAELTRLRTP